VATPPSLRVAYHNLVVYKRTWRGSVVFSFLTPVLYLAAMGLGLGSLIKGQRSESLGGLSYLSFVAPGLLAATVMQVAAGESMYPIMGGIKWWKTYHAMLATPVRVRDLVAGELIWIAVRITLVATIYTAIIAVFGIAESITAVLAIPAAIACGMAFAAPIAAFSATQESDQGFVLLFRLMVVPLFLFSGAFFPVSQLPSGLQKVAKVTPLYHGVELCRSLILGTAGFTTSIAHLAYLVLWIVVGWRVCLRTFDRRLAP
jgi:lipooligosaccharide transport system permease protein